jgi:SAM-dependent methyltransferase
MTDRPYAIHSDAECERLEAQARLAPISSHLKNLSLRPGYQVLDAGCGSGSMARLMAQTERSAQIVGIDLRETYIDFAQRKAALEGIQNVKFEVGDVRKLPFENGTLDLVWSKYLLQWVDDPISAVREFARVLKPGGILVCCNFDGFAVTNEPPDPAIQPLTEYIFSKLVDPFIGRKMAAICRGAGLSEVRVAIEMDAVFTVIGAIDSERRQNWETQWAAARASVIKHVGSRALADAFIDAFLRYQDREDTSSYCTLFFVSARKPLP